MSASEDVEKELTGAATMENSMNNVQKNKNRINISSSILLLGIYPKETGTIIWKETRIWKQPKYPSTDKWIKM